MSLLPADFWKSEPMAPIPSLAQLREAVLRHNDNKRCPKWGFRLGDDMAVQLQPRPVFMAMHNMPQRSLQFDGTLHAAVEGDEYEDEDDEGGAFVPANVFRLSMKELRQWDGDWLRVQFLLFAHPGDATWTFRPRGIRWSARMPAEVVVFYRDLIPSMLPLRLATLRPELMLSRSCLVCGKALTDPVSVARWIGPECYGNGSLTLDGMDRDRVAEKMFQTT
jgi:hypothetical protein